MFKPSVSLHIRNVVSIIEVNIVDLLVVLACLWNRLALNNLHLVFHDVCNIAILGSLRNYVALLYLCGWVHLHVLGLIHHHLRVVQHSALVHLLHSV